MAVYPKSETDRRVPAAHLDSVVAAIFQRCGMNPADAKLLTDSPVHADLRGVHSHGVSSRTPSPRNTARTAFCLPPPPSTK